VDLAQGNCSQIPRLCLLSRQLNNVLLCSLVHKGAQISVLDFTDFLAAVRPDHDLGGLTLWCTLGLLVGGAIQVLRLQLQFTVPVFKTLLHPHSYRTWLCVCLFVLVPAVSVSPVWEDPKMNVCTGIVLVCKASMNLKSSSLRCMKHKSVSVMTPTHFDNPHHSHSTPHCGILFR